MGRFSLSASSPEEHEDRLERYTPPDNDIVETSTPSLNPIYVYYNQPPPRQQQQRRISVWWWFVAAVILAHVVARYGPPAPPPTSTPLNNNWEDFFMEEVTRMIKSIITLGSVIPHVWHWCAQGIRQEVGELYEEWTRPPACPIVLGSQNSDWHIVGQPKAASIVSDALDAWDQRSSLFLLLTGTVGVGKLELAMQIARHVYGDCCNAVLVLDGQDDNADLMTTTVLQHVQRQQGNGAVVILRHPEALTAGQYLHVCQLLQRQDTVIFVTITGIGTRTIHQNLKRYGSMERIPKVELEMSIRDEVDETFDEDVAKYFHAIAPFVPIGQRELQEILQLKIERISQQQAGKQWKFLIMTDELAAALIDPAHVEYIEWKDKSTGETVLVFSGAGAKVLETGSPIMNKVTAQIKRCFSASTTDCVGKLDYDKATRQGVVSWCDDSSVCEECCRFSLD